MAGVGLFHHLVDLLERETFGFGLGRYVSLCKIFESKIVMTYNQEVGKCRGDAAEGTPKEEDLGTEVRVALVGTD